MTDAQKLQVIDSIVSTAYEWEPKATENRGAYFEGVISSILAVLLIETAGDESAEQH